MKCFVYINDKVKTFDCRFEELPKEYKNYPVLQYKTNRMSCTEWTQLYNSNWEIKEADYFNPVRLIDPLKEEMFLNSSYIPDIVEHIFKIISFPNWEIAGKFIELEKKLKEKDNQVNLLKRENEELKREIEELKGKITKRNRLIKRLRKNSQVVII